MRILVAIAFSAVLHSVAVAQLAAQLSELRRDPALEQQVLERRSSQAQLLQSEAKAKITLATNATLARLASASGDSDASAIALEEVSRQFRRLTPQQSELLTFQVLAELNGILASEQDTRDRLGTTDSEVVVRMQLMTDRRSKFMEALSNMMKKVSETEQAIIQNLK